MGKAWKEVSFIEIIAEAFGGFVFAFIALNRGWLDYRGAFETVIECVGCAVLIPIIAFVLRVIFSAPAELVKESAESRRKDEIQPKSIYPAIIATLLAICAFLLVGLAFSLKIHFTQPGEKNIAVLTEKKESQKPLPDIIIPAPEQPPPAAPAPQVASMEPQKQFENFNDRTGAIESAMTELNAIKSNRIAASELVVNQMNAELQSKWSNSLPYFQRAITVLRDKLKTESLPSNDGIRQSKGYLTCLPTIISPSVNNSKVAEIGYQTASNLDFSITIQHRLSACGLRIESGICFSGNHLNPRRFHFLLGCN